MSLWRKTPQPRQTGGAWIELDRTLRDNYREFFGDLVADVLESRGLRGKLSEPLLVEATPYQWGKSPQEYRAVVLKTLNARLSMNNLKAIQGGDSGIFGDFSQFPGAEHNDDIREALENRRIRFVTGRTQQGFRVVGVVILQ